MYLEAFQIEAEKDAIDLVALIELSNELIGTVKFLDNGQRHAYKPILDIAVTACDNIGLKRAPVGDANTGAFFKLMADIAIFAKDLPRAKEWLLIAVNMMENDKGIDCHELEAQCRQLIDLIDKSK